MAIVQKNTHRMPVETTSDMDQWAKIIEGKERKEKERNIIGKDKKREEDKRKGNRFPCRSQTRGYSGETTHLE